MASIIMIYNLFSTNIKNVNSAFKEPGSPISISKNQYVINLLDKKDSNYDEFNKILNLMNPKFKDIYNKNHKQMVLVIENDLSLQWNLEQLTRNTLEYNSYINKLMIYDCRKKTLVYTSTNSKINTISLDKQQLIDWCKKTIDEENALYNKTLHERTVYINIVIGSLILAVFLFLVLLILRRKLKILNSTLTQ